MAWKLVGSHHVLPVVMTLTVLGCAMQLDVVAPPDQVTDSLVVGRTVTGLLGERARRYLPKMQFFELEHQESHKRFQVMIESPDQHFAISVPHGTYQLTRVQISEGPFRSMADLPMTFSVGVGAVTYVGAWQFGVDSPRYGRMVAVSVTVDQAEAAKAHDFFDGQYPTFKDRSMVEMLPQPTQMHVRLYEVTPYPRYSRYFRRHWW